MNTRRPALRSLLICLLTTGLGLALIVCVHEVRGQSRQVDPDLTAHEWGTFTSVAGNDGKAVEWLPLFGSWPSYPVARTANDLPAFIEHFGYGGFKVGLRGTVRMETPVIYFYSPRNVDLSVHVSFARGLITEWYPHASRVSPAWNPSSASLNKNSADGSIFWDAVHVEPGLAPDFPRETTESHYYAARETAATPVRVAGTKGDEREKFLFYRGVSAFSVPVSAKVMPSGDLLVNNLGKVEVPGLVLFERRGEKMGYRIINRLQSQITLQSPELNSGIESLYADLEQMLVAQGLYWDEAHAMVQTWRNSWFEEGSRLFYIVPPSFVDTVLPLTINPAPAKTVRVFVGRIELATSAIQNGIETALEEHNQVKLAKFSRFLEPFLKIMTEHDPAKEKKIKALLSEPCEP
jgi:hypothetical protein